MKYRLIVIGFSENKISPRALYQKREFIDSVDTDSDLTLTKKKVLMKLKLSTRLLMFTTMKKANEGNKSFTKYQHS